MQVKPIADDNSLPSNDGLNKWVESEIGASHFADERLAKRFGTLLGMLTRRVGDSLPAACEDWANTKAAYRFFSNDRVTEQEILAGYFVSTARRVLSSAEETFLVLHDTSEFSYNRGKRAIWVSFPNFPMANHRLIPPLIDDWEEFSCTRVWSLLRAASR